MIGYDVFTDFISRIVFSETYMHASDKFVGRKKHEYASHVLPEGDHPTSTCGSARPAVDMHSFEPVSLSHRDTTTRLCHSVT